MDSTQKRMERIVAEGGEGKVYFPDDFFDCGSPKAVSKALQRMVESEVLMRMTRGVYCSPTESQWGMGRLPASSDEVVKAVVEREGIRLAPSSGEAQNMLGLSDQVVMNPVFSTDGPSRKINWRDGFSPIYFDHVSPKVFNYRNRVIMLTVIALSEIGKESLWEFDLSRLREIYSHIPYSEIRTDLKSTPSWIRNVILDMYAN